MRLPSTVIHIASQRATEKEEKDLDRYIVGCVRSMNFIEAHIPQIESPQQDFLRCEKTIDHKQKQFYTVSTRFLKKKNLISDCDDDFEVVSNWMIAVCVCVVLTDRYNGVCLLMRSKCLRSISFWAKVIYNFYCSYSISKTSRVLSFSSYIAYQSTFAVTDAQHQLIKRSCAILVGRRVASIQQ